MAQKGHCKGMGGGGVEGYMSLRIYVLGGVSRG